MTKTKRLLKALGLATCTTIKMTLIGLFVTFSIYLAIYHLVWFFVEFLIIAVIMQTIVKYNEME